MKLGLILFFNLLCLVCFSQTKPDEDVYKSIQEEMNEEFKSLKDSINNDYENVKKAVWEEYELLSEKGFKKPKPKVMPIYLPNVNPPVLKPTPLVLINPKPIKKEPLLKLPDDDFTNKTTKKFKDELLRIVKQTTDVSNVDFFGAEFKLYHNGNMNIVIKSPSKKAIELGVKVLSENKEDVDAIAYQLAHYATIMKLNDYAFLKLVLNSAKTIFKDKTAAVLFTWYVALQKGYDCRLAFNALHGFYLATHSEVKMFGIKCFYSNGKKYYVIPLDKEDLDDMKKVRYLKSYKNNPFNSKLNVVDFVFDKVPEISSEIGVSEKNIERFKLNNNITTMNLSYDVSFVEMFKEMPAFDYAYYYEAPVSKKAEETLSNRLSPLLQGKDEVSKVKIILKFVHNFPYKLDKDNFNLNERPMIPEEMLYYKYSDCEDHAALFSYLVNRFTNCEVVGVLLFTKTSGHATTAVKFPNGVKPNGYYLPAPYQDYIMCDPTYFGASIGVCQPPFVGVQPQRVFKVRKFKH